MSYLSDDNFESFQAEVLSQKIVDLRDVSFIDPYGMVGILELGRFFTSGNIKSTLLLPESERVLMYLERMDFFRFAGHYFHLKPERPDLPDTYLRSSQSDVLLEITPIEKSDDIHFIVGRVKKRAHMILARHLHYDERAINGFIVALSEVCQNIIEHSGNPGFVGIQKYYFQKHERNVVKIAVMDLGIGFRESLAERVQVKTDLEAIEQALMHGISRYNEKGRGHGLAAVKRFITQWKGKLSIRSGTDRFSIIPDWAFGRKREHNLNFLPGAQISMILPEV